LKSFVIVVTLAAAALSGCATVGGAHALATPWGVGGVYSFRDKAAPTNKPSERSVNMQVAQALDHLEQASDEDVRVASR
jgi:hypothetical protein